MADNVDAVVREGISALKAGNKDEARTLLEKAVELDERSEEAWLWLSAVVDAPDDQRTCLENVLAINPNNKRAQQGLHYLDQSTPAGAASAPAASPPAPIETKTPPTDYASTPSSIGWETQGSGSASEQPARRGMELSKDDYESWVSNVDLPSDSPSASVSPFYTEIDDLPDVSEPEPARVEKKPKRQKREEPVREAPRPSEPAVEFDDVLDEPEYEPLFPDIPHAIKATRLPGTIERLPIPLIILLVLLIGLNVVAVIFLAQSLFAA
ncbi:MAG: hypothetical protein KJ065_27165 [Anaerolineae bacterium]|nr:hypothetical protein [Anaerolineae bacterium]